MPMAAAGSLGAGFCRRRDPLVQAKQVLAELLAELAAELEAELEPRVDLMRDEPA